MQAAEFSEAMQSISYMAKRYTSHLDFLGALALTIACHLARWQAASPEIWQLSTCLSAGSLCRSLHCLPELTVLLC